MTCSYILFDNGISYFGQKTAQTSGTHLCTMYLFILLSFLTSKFCHYFEMILSGKTSKVLVAIKC